VPVGDDRALAEAMSRVVAQPLPTDTLREAAEPYTLAASADRYLFHLGLPPSAGHGDRA